jgi:hypothetical protein
LLVVTPIATALPGNTQPAPAAIVIATTWVDPPENTRVPSLGR